MDTNIYNNCLSNSLFLDSKNDCIEGEDSSTDEDTSLGEDDPVPNDYDESEEDEEDSDDDENEKNNYNKFIRKRIVPQLRSRQTGKPVKTVKKNKIHNTMERVRRNKVTMCYTVLRSAMGVTDVSRNKCLEVASDLIKKYTTRIKEVDDKIEEYENKIKSMMAEDVGMMSTSTYRNKFIRP